MIFTIETSGWEATVLFPHPQQDERELSVVLVEVRLKPNLLDEPVKNTSADAQYYGVLIYRLYYNITRATMI